MDLDRRKAVAMAYDQKEHAAPVLLVKGQGAVADEIIRLAREFGITVYQDRSLVEILYLLRIYQEIPEELYKAVAAIFARLYEIDRGSAGNRP